MKLENYTWNEVQGYPSFANEEKGKKLFSRMKKSALEFVNKNKA